MLCRRFGLILLALFNLTYRYIDDVLFINNPDFSNWIPLIYPPELEIKETTETASLTSFLDLHLEFDTSSRLHTIIYDKLHDFNFNIINFPHLSSNIPTSPAYGIYISQLIRYARACSSYSDFVQRHRCLSIKLMNQGFVRERLILFLKKFIGRYQDLIEKYSVSTSTLIKDGLDA